MLPLYHARLAILGIVAVLGLFLIKGMLTGFVISESCCMPDATGCLPENACTPAETQGTPVSTSFIGLGLFLVATLLVIGELHWEKKKKETAKREEEKREYSVL